MPDCSQYAVGSLAWQRCILQNDPVTVPQPTAPIISVPVIAGSVTPKTYWFIFGLILVAVLGMYAPKIGGVLVLLVVTVLAIESANKKLL